MTVVGPDNGTALVFDPFSADFFNDPHAFYPRLRREAPVYYNEEYDFYALSRHADVAAGLKDFETYSSACRTWPAGRMCRSGDCAEPARSTRVDEVAQALRRVDGRTGRPHSIG
jgi:cytochrome P450